MSDQESRNIPQESDKDSSLRGAPANSEASLSNEDALIKQLMEPKAPEEDTSKDPEAVSASEAATRTDNKGAPPEDDSEAVVAEDEAPEEAPEESDEGEEPEETEETVAEADEEPEEDESGAEVMYNTPDGEPVTLDELKRGFLRQSDYTKKTQEIAALRDQAAQSFQALEQHNSTVAEHLSLALNVVEPQLAELGQTDWDALAASDPYEYAEKKALYEQASVRYNSLQEAAKATVEQDKARLAHVNKQRVQAEQQKLQMALPDLADPKQGPKLARAIKNYALESGLSDKEASNITDHRLIVMLNKARQFDELSQSSLTAAKKKISKSPKNVARAGQPSSKAEQNSAKRSQARARLKSSGSVDDMVAMLMQS